MAQESVSDFLRGIEEQSLHMRAERQNADARAIASRVGINPANPEVNYEYMPGTHQTEGVRQTYGVTQQIDWPGVYSAKSKYAKLEQQQAGADFAGLRQDMLLRAKQVCYEMVYLTKMDRILTRRLELAGQTRASTHKRFEMGEATALDINRAEMFLATVRAQLMENRLLMETDRSELAIICDVPYVETAGFAYIDNPAEDLSGVVEEAMASAPSIRAVRLEADKSRTNISIQRAETLPSFNVGVAGEQITAIDSFFGVTAGVSIPLWGGANKVKAAKARNIAVALRAQSTEVDTRLLLENTVARAEMARERFLEGVSLKNIHEGIALVAKDFELGNSSIVAYLGELLFYYENESQWLTLEYEMYVALAEALKHRL
jgi:outer membrane protein TolC